MAGTATQVANACFDPSHFMNAVVNDTLSYPSPATHGSQPALTFKDGNRTIEIR
jgi:hypothetical protein